MTRIIAHRGASKVFPENSLAAFLHAQKCGADALEVDLRKSADGRIYCFHDRLLGRLTGYKGDFEQTHSQTIDKLTVGRAEPVLRFTEFLKRFVGKIGIVLDIKSSGIEERILELTQSCSGSDTIVFSSFHPDILRRIQSLNPTSHTALIAGPVRNLRPRFDLTEYLATQLAELGCYGIHLSRRIAGKKRVTRFKELGYSVAVWTVDDSKTAVRYLDLDTDGIISNTPEVLVREIIAVRSLREAVAPE